MDAFPTARVEPYKATVAAMTWVAKELNTRKAKLRHDRSRLEEDFQDLQ